MGVYCPPHGRSNCSHLGNRLRGAQLSSGINADQLERSGDSARNHPCQPPLSVSTNQQLVLLEWWSSRSEDTPLLHFHSHASKQRTRSLDVLHDFSSFPWYVIFPVQEPQHFFLLLFPAVSKWTQLAAGKSNYSWKCKMLGAALDLDSNLVTYW